MRRLYIILITIIIVIIGVSALKFFKDKQEFSDASEITMTYVKNNFKDIKTIEVTETEYSPIGTIFVSGYINNDENLKFSSNVNPKEKMVNSISTSEKFPETKEECKDTVCE